MATTYNDTGADGSGLNFTYTFPVIKNADIKVALNGITQASTKYTVNTSVNPTRIEFNNTSIDSTLQESTGAPKSGVVVRVYRDTGLEDPADKRVVFAAGSAIKAQDLNNLYEHFLYHSQEEQNQLERITDADVIPTAEIQVSKLKDGTARQILQTDAAGTGVEWTSNVDVPGTLDVTGAVDFDSTLNVDGTATLDILDVNGSATIDNVQINGNEIDTTSGELTIDSAGGIVNVDDQLVVTGQVTANGTLVAADISGAAVVTSGTSTSDTKVYSAKRCDELYYNIGTAEEIQSGETWSAADNKIATTAAIDARIVDLVDEVGGFVPIANETSFPNANPDVNNGAGTIVSIGVLASNRTSNGSGVISIPNGTVGNSTVTINGAANSTTYTAGYGLLVETTSTLNTYTFHRYAPKATEVTTVASNISNVNAAANNQTNINAAVSNASNINTVAGIASNVTTVAGIQANVTAVAGDAADIGACSTNIGSIAAIGSDLANNFENISDYGAITGAVTSTSGTSDISTLASGSNLTNIATITPKVTEIGRLGTADAVADMALLGTTACVADMAILGTADVVADMNLLGTAAVVEDLNLLGTSACIADMAIIADTSNLISNIGTVASNNSNVTTCASNITNINNASTHAANALTYRNDSSAILTQVESSPYNLADSVSSHTAWGNITDTGANAVFTNESSNILLTMAEGSSNYNYGSIT